jgi:hypothetical protein
MPVAFRMIRGVDALRGEIGVYVLECGVEHSCQFPVKEGVINLRYEKFIVFRLCEVFFLSGQGSIYRQKITWLALVITSSNLRFILARTWKSNFMVGYVAMISSSLAYTCSRRYIYLDGVRRERLIRARRSKSEIFRCFEEHIIRPNVPSRAFLLEIRLLKCQALKSTLRTLRCS